MADYMNDTPKLVVSTSLDAVGWRNSALIDGNGNLVEELTKLKRAPGKDILVTGSATLVQSLLRKGLLDELVLWVHPIVKGRGRRPFDDLRDQVPVKLVDSKTFSSGLVSLSYKPRARAESRSRDERTARRAPAGV
jgi:dihydrofolate reductase